MEVGMRLIEEEYCEQSQATHTLYVNQLSYQFDNFLSSWDWFAKNLKTFLGFLYKMRR